MKSKNVLNMSLTAMFTATMLLLTRFVSINFGAGYVHFGDAGAYIIASMMGGPYSIFAVVVGEAIADITYGFIMYCPATIIIKLLMVLPFIAVCKKSKKILTPLTVIFSIVAGVINVGGYFIADLIINKAFAVTNIYSNVVQSVASVIIFILVAIAFDSAKLKKKLF